MTNDVSSPEALLFHFIPTFFLRVIELARQGIDRNVVLRTELAPQHKAQVVLSGGVGNGVINGGRLFLWITSQHDFFYPNYEIVFGECNKS